MSLTIQDLVIAVLKKEGVELQIVPNKEVHYGATVINIRRDLKDKQIIIVYVSTSIPTGLEPTFVAREAITFGKEIINTPVRRIYAKWEIDGWWVMRQFSKDLIERSQ